MTTRFFSLLLFLLPLLLPAQNLVPNPSFEEFENGCPENHHEMPLSWTWWRESPNSFNTCVEPENLVDSLGWAPWNGFGYQEPYDGDAYVGFYAFGSQVHAQNFREYLGCELDETLEVGEIYYVSLQTSMAFDNYFYPTCASNRIGVYFTTQDYDENNPLPIPNFAHIYEETIITDTTEWVTISGTFVADQAYTHMGLGVFFEYDQLQTLNLVQNDICLSYYYMDDICVSRFPICNITTHSPVVDDLDIKMYPNPTNSFVTILGFEAINSIRLITIGGKEIKNYYNPGIYEIRIDISDVPDGSYLLEVQGEKFIKRERLLIVH